MANHRGAPFEFVDRREILQGPQIQILLYSSPAAARRQQHIDSYGREQQNRDRPPPSHLPKEVDDVPPIGLVNRYFGLEDDEVDDSRPPRSPTTTTSELPLVVDGATKVVRLAGMLSPDDLRDDVFYQEVLEDFIVEACKFGSLVEAVIPRPGGDQAVLGGGVGKVFLRYACLDASIRCMTMMDWRWFAGRRVVAQYFPEDRFAAGDYGYDVV